MIKSISIVIPVYNEGKFIFQTLEKVAKSNTLKLGKEIIVVDDGSKDNTAEEVNSFIKKNKSKYLKIILLKNKLNLGKGATCKKGFLEATGDLVMIQDADLEYSPDDYPTMLAPFFEHGADVVYGSRFVTNKPHRVLYYWHYVANKMLTTLSNILTNLNFTDMETGYKIFKKHIIDQIAPKLESQRFGIEAELTAKLAKIKDKKIYEVGISYTGRSYEEGKKIGWKDGVKNIWEILKYNLKPLKFNFLTKFVSKIPIKNKFIFVLILFLGIFLRTTGIFWGLNTNGIKHGSPYHDEGHMYNYVLDKNFLKNFGEYEIAKPVYLYKVFYDNISNLLDKLDISPKEFTSAYKVYGIMRIFTAVFGISSILVVFIIAKKIFNEKTALFVMTVYTLLPGHWFMSQLAKGEAVVTFFIPLILYLGYLLTKSSKPILFIITGLILGLAMSTKATFLVALPAFGFLCLIALYNNRKNLYKTILCFIVLVISAFFVFKTFYPYPFCCLENYKAAIADPNNAFQRTSIKRYSISPESIQYIWSKYQSKDYPFFTLAFTEPATYLHLIGIAILLFVSIYRIKNKQDSNLVLALLITYAFFFLSLNQYGDVNEDRYVVPFAPFVAIFAGAIFYYTDKKIPKIRLITNIIMMLIIGYMFLFSFAYFYPYAVSDPRSKTATFLEKNMQNNESVFILLPSSRDKIFLNKDTNLVFNYDRLSEVETKKISPDYIVVYRTINHKGRWGSFNFLGEIAENPYGYIIPDLIETEYNYITTFGKRPEVLGKEKPETYITPTFDIYKLR